MVVLENTPALSKQRKLVCRQHDSKTYMEKQRNGKSQNNFEKDLLESYSNQDSAVLVKGRHRSMTSDRTENPEISHMHRPN